MNPSSSSPLLFLGAPGLIGNQVIPVLINAGSGWINLILFSR
jgi:hypothetical protein